MKFNIDIVKVVNDMLQAALPYFQKGGQQVSGYASHEFQQYIINLEHVQNLVETNKISDEEAQYLVNQYKFSMKAVLLSIEGLGVIAVQQAINAAIDVLNVALQTALGAAIGTIKFAI